MPLAEPLPGSTAMNDCFTTHGRSVLAIPSSRNPERLLDRIGRSAYPSGSEGRL